MKKSLLVLAALLALSACDRLLPPKPDLTLPSAAVVQQTYAQQGVNADFRFSGNVLEMVVQQPADGLRRGGPLWARVGPYIYVFSPATRQIFDEYPGIAGVRTITMAGDAEVARAMLVRDALNEYGWRRALNVLGEALESGTERPATMDRLVQFGEQHTQYEYNPRYVPRR